MAKIKGVFYTFGAFFLVMLVVVLSLLVATTVKQSDTRLTESGSLDRIYVLDRSIQRVLSEIDNGIHYESDWDSSNNFTNILISEKIDESFSDYASDLYSELNSFSSFVESDQAEISFNLSKIYNDNYKIPIMIRPYNFEYSHINEEDNIILSINPNTYLTGIEVTLFLHEGTVSESSIDWNTQNSGDFSLNITLYDEASNTHSATYSVNEALLNEFRINNEIDLTIGRNCSACIEIDRGNINITTTYSTSLPYVAEQVTFHYPRGLYLINFSDIGISLNSMPRIL